MAKPWEDYQSPPSKEVQSPTSFDPDAYLAMKQREALSSSQSPPAPGNFDLSTAKPVDLSNQFDKPINNQNDYLCVAEAIAILWLPILLLGWYYKTKQLPPSGWRRSGAVISVLILLLGSIESISEASHGRLTSAILVSCFAALPWIIGYTAKWIIDGFRSN